MSVIPKVAFKHAIFIYVEQLFNFCEIQKPILKFIWNFRRFGVPKTILTKRSKLKVLNSKVTSKPQKSNKCGIGIRTDLQNNEIK